MLSIKYLEKNQKRTIITILSVVLGTILFLVIGLACSTARDYLIKISDKYHVTLETDAVFKNDKIKDINYKNNQYFITYKNIKDTYQETSKICKDKCQKITYNNTLLSLYGISENNSLQIFYKILIIILTVVGIGIFLIIHNAFGITVLERQKQFGILKSMGMTRKQIIKMILSESLIVLILGLLIGMLFSILIGLLFILIINNLLGDILISKLSLSIYPSFIIIPIIYITTITFISAFLPALNIAKKSIIETIKNSKNYKHYKSPKKYKKITTVLAYQNYKRCKKKYKPITLGIFISVLLYITFSLYLNYGLKSINDYASIPKYDAEISIQNTGYDTLNELVKTHNFDKYNLFKNCALETHIDESNYLNDKYYKDKLILNVISGNEEVIINKIKETSNKNHKITKIDTEYLKTGEIVFNNQKQNIKLTNDIPFGLDSLLTKDSVTLITNNFDKYCPNYTTTLLVKGDIDLQKELKKIADKDQVDIDYYDVKKGTKITKNIVLAIQLILYGLTFLVILIAMTSVMQTFLTSIDLRRKEIGILRSIGTTNKQIKNMLIKESVFIILKGFIYAIPFIFLLDYILYISLNQIMDTNFIIPIKELMVSFAISLFIIYITINKCYNKLLKKDIIFLINQDNI